jgi:hypothetical protein
LVDGYAYILVFAWGGLVITWVNRRIPHELHREALKKLDESGEIRFWLVRFVKNY